MNRLLLALLLLTSLWPMVAGMGAEVRVQDQITPLSVSSAAEAVRAAGGLELLSGLERSGAGERSPSVTLLFGAGTAFPRRPVQHLVGAESLARQAVVLPRLAHLPYFATAPPRG